MPTIHRSVSIMAGVVSWIRASTRFDLKTSAGNAVKCKLIEILLAVVKRAVLERREDSVLLVVVFFVFFFVFFFDAHTYNLIELENGMWCQEWLISPVWRSGSFSRLLGS